MNLCIQQQTKSSYSQLFSNVMLNPKTLVSSDKKFQFSFPTAYTAYKMPATLSLNSTACLSSTAKVSESADHEAQIKKIKKQYDIRIIQLENELNFMKEELEYKDQAHKRQMESLKAMLQYQFSKKINQIKCMKLSDLDSFNYENNSLKQKIKHLDEQNRLLKIRYERSEKYNKEVDTIGKDKLEKLTKQFEQTKKIMASKFQSDRKQASKQFQQQLKIIKSEHEKIKQELQLKVITLTRKINQIEPTIAELKQQLKQEKIDKQDIRIQKDKIIREQGARLEALRQASIMQEVASKKEARQIRLMEIDNSVKENFECRNRKNLTNIESYRNDLQKQILLEREMKKLYEEERMIISQIKKVNTKFINKSTTSNSNSSLSQSQAKKGYKVLESPQFGLKNQSYCQI